MGYYINNQYLVWAEEFFLPTIREGNLEGKIQKCRNAKMQKQKNPKYKQKNVKLKNKENAVFKTQYLRNQ